MARVLIADDDRDIRELMAWKLRQEGHTVVAVTDGEFAVDAARRERPDLVVLDVVMPGMTGLDARRALRADHATADLPIILVTARWPEDDVARELDGPDGPDDHDRGPDDAYVYVTKPFSPRELARRVADALARATPGPPGATVPGPGGA